MPGVEWMCFARNRSGWLTVHTQSRGPNQGDGEAGGEFSRSGSLSCLPAPCRTGAGRFAFLFRPDRNRRLCRPVHGAWIGLIGPD